MAFRELRGFAREIFLEKKIEQIEAIYRKAQKDLERKLASVAVSEFDRTRIQALLSQINQELAVLDKGAKQWADASMKLAYEKGLEVAEGRLSAMGVTKYVNFDAKIHVGAVNVLADQVALDFITANQTIKNNVSRYLRLTQQRVIEDQQISKMIAQGLVEGQTRKQISDTILEQFKKKLGEGKSMTINGRDYQPEAYSRLVARSRFVEASNQASVNAALQYGVDLVQVDVHSLKSDCICYQFQGKIFSISGNDPNFPPLDERPPYHPNCTHQLLPITRESLEARGLFDNAVKFSNQSSNLGASTFKEFEDKVNV